MPTPNNYASGGSAFASGRSDVKESEFNQHMATLVAQLKAVENDVATTAVFQIYGGSYKARLKTHECLAKALLPSLKEELCSILITRLQKFDAAGFFLILTYFFSNNKMKIDHSGWPILSGAIFPLTLNNLDDNSFVKFLQLFDRPEYARNSWRAAKDYSRLSATKLEALFSQEKLLFTEKDIPGIVLESTSDVFLKYIELTKDKPTPKLVWDALEGKRFYSPVHTQIHGIIANLSPQALGVYLNLMTGNIEDFKLFLDKNPYVKKILFSYMLYEPSWKDLSPNNNFISRDEKSNPQATKTHLAEKIILFTGNKFLISAHEVWLQGKEIPDYLAVILVKLFPVDKPADYNEMLIYLAKKTHPDLKQSELLTITTNKNKKINLADYKWLPENVLTTIWSEGLKMQKDVHQLQSHILMHQDSEAEAMLSGLMQMHDAKNEIVVGCDISYYEYKTAVSKVTEVCLDIDADNKDSKRESIEQQYQQAYAELGNSIKTNLLCIKIIAEIKEEKRWEEFVGQLENYDARHFQTRVNQKPHLPAMKYRFLDKVYTPYEEHTAVHDQKTRSKIQAHKKILATHAPKTPATAVVNLSNTTFGETDPIRQVGVFLRGPTDANDLMQQIADSKAHRPHTPIQVVVKMTSRRDIGTVDRWWVNTENLIRQHLLNVNHFIYAARDYDNYLKAIGDNVNQTNEILIKPSRESMIGIPVLTITTETLALARQRFIDVYKRLKLVLPVVHYDRFNRRVSLIPLQRLFSMKFMVVPDKSVYVTAEFMGVKQFDLLWVMLFRDSNKVENIQKAPLFKLLSFRYPKQFSALTLLNEYCNKNVERDKKFIQIMQASSFTKFYQFYTQYDDCNFKENPVLAHRANMNNLEFAMIMISLKKIKHARYTMDNQSIDTMPVGDFIKNIWDKDKHVCDEKGAVLSIEQLQVLFDKRSTIILTPLAVMAKIQEKPKALELLRKNMRWEIVYELHPSVLLSMIDHLHQQIESGTDALPMAKKIGDLHQWWYSKKSTPALPDFPAYMYVSRYSQNALHEVNYVISTGANTKINMLSTSGSELLQHFLNEGMLEFDAKNLANGCIDNFNRYFRAFISTVIKVRTSLSDTLNYLTGKPFQEQDRNAICRSLDASKVLQLYIEFSDAKTDCPLPMLLYFDHGSSDVMHAILCTLKPELINLDRFSNIPDSKNESVDMKLLTMPLNRFMEMLWKENGVRSDAKSTLVPLKKAIEVYALKKIYPLKKLLLVLDYLRRVDDSHGAIKKLRSTFTWAQVKSKSIYDLAILIELNEQAIKATEVSGHHPYTPFIESEETEVKRNYDFYDFAERSVKTMGKFPVIHFFRKNGNNVCDVYFVVTGKGSCIDILTIRPDAFLDRLWKEGFKHFIYKNEFSYQDKDNDKNKNKYTYKHIYKVDSEDDSDNEDEYKNGNIDGKKMYTFQNMESHLLPFWLKNDIILLGNLSTDNTPKCKLFREHVAFARVQDIFRNFAKYLTILQEATESKEASGLRFFGLQTNTLAQLKPLLAQMDKSKYNYFKITSFMEIHQLLFNTIRNSQNSKYRTTQAQNFYIDLYENLFGVRLNDKGATQKVSAGPSGHATVAPKSP